MHGDTIYVLLLHATIICTQLVRNKLMPINDQQLSQVHVLVYTKMRFQY